MSGEKRIYDALRDKDLPQHKRILKEYPLVIHRSPYAIIEHCQTTKAKKSNDKAFFNDTAIITGLNDITDVNKIYEDIMRTFRPSKFDPQRRKKPETDPILSALARNILKSPSHKENHSMLDSPRSKRFPTLNTDKKSQKLWAAIGSIEKNVKKLRAGKYLDALDRESARATRLSLPRIYRKRNSSIPLSIELSSTFI